MFVYFYFCVLNFYQIGIYSFNAGSLMLGYINIFPKMHILPANIEELDIHHLGY